MNAAEFSWDTVRDLIDLPFGAEEVQAAFFRAGVDPGNHWEDVPIRLAGEGQQTDELVSVSEIDLIQDAGFRIRCHRAHHLPMSDVAGVGWVFSEVTWVAASEDSAGFSGGLPSGLVFGDSAEAAVAKVGRSEIEKGENSSGSRTYRRWSQGKHWLQISTSEDKGLERVIFYMQAT